jgi:putative addiction module component (TIGR02574 family)
MTATLKSLAETVIRLPPRDRAFLAERLLHSLDEAEIEQAWIDEAKRRCYDVRSGKVKPIAAGEVYRRIEALLKR